MAARDHVPKLVWLGSFLHFWWSSSVDIASLLIPTLIPHLLPFPQDNHRANATSPLPCSVPGAWQYT